MRDICSARASRSSSSFCVTGLGGQYWYDVRHDATTQPVRGYAAALLRSVSAISCARRWSFSTSWRLNSESASIMLIPTCCRTNCSASSLLVHAVDRIDVLARDPRAAHLVALAGGADQCRRRILRDYFRHGFDGSGSDGGSCVDGRLTSSWNWCSLVEKKSYYPILLATGFTGFDGSFS